MRERCKICGSEKSSIIEKFDAFQIVGCDSCNYGEVDPIPNEEELSSLYNSEEYYRTHMNYDFNELSDIDIEVKINKALTLHYPYLKNKIVPKNTSLLEIGSGGGFALKAFKNLGLDVLGIETSKVASDFSINKLGIDVINSSIEEVSIKKQFDVVMLNHVLEHFIDVNIAMQKLTSFLKKDGILYVRVPDLDSFDRRKYGKKWPAYAQYHISNFSEKSLQILFQKNQLEVVEVDKFISEKIPLILRKIMNKTPMKNYFAKKFNGRTITIIGRKK